MTDGAGLLAAIITNPDDDTARLVFADWLQENGKEPRAEFIRTQVEHHRIIMTAGDLWVDHRLPRKKPLPLAETQERALKTKMLKLLRQEGKLWDEYGVRELSGCHFLQGGPMRLWRDWFIRGFIEVIECPADVWVKSAERLFWHPSTGRECHQTAHPIRKVALLNPGELSLTADKDGKLWCARYPGVEFELPAASPFGEPELPILDLNSLT